MSPWPGEKEKVKPQNNKTERNWFRNKVPQIFPKLRMFAGDDDDDNDDDEDDHVNDACS